MTAPPAGSWLLWCGPGQPVPVQPGLEAAAVPAPGRGDRAFAAFRAPGGPEHMQLQLAAAPGSRLVVAFSGWLINEPEVAADLAPRTAPPCGGAELALACYREGGRPWLHRLRGTFATVVWDGDEDTLVAVRDTLGVHPLFWAQAGKSLVLSDTIATLIGHPAVSAELNRAAIADRLRWMHPDTGETFFRAVRRIPACHDLVANGRGRQIERTGSPAWSARDGWASAEEVAGFDDLFARKVAAGLHHGPTAVWLSGGIDSVSVAAFAASHASAHSLRTPMACSLRFPDPDGDESDVQRQVAEALGFPQVMLELSEAVAPLGVFESALAAAAVDTAPPLGPWNAAYAQLTRLARQAGCTTILTGGGGDEGLGVSPFVAADMLAEREWVALWRLVHAAVRSYNQPPLREIRLFVWTCGVRALLGRRVLPRYAPWAVAFYDSWRLARATPAWLAPDPALRREIDARFVPPAPVANFYERDVELSIEHPLLAMHFDEMFEMGRREGVRFHFPFFDPDLVELLQRTPPDVLNRNGRAKGMVRDTIDRRFPELGFGEQRKVTSVSTVDRLVRSESPGLWQRTGSARALAELGIVDVKQLEEATPAALVSKSTQEQWRHGFDLLALEVFARVRS